RAGHRQEIPPRVRPRRGRGAFRGGPPHRLLPELTPMFTPWDWAVVALYFAVLAGIGACFSRRNRDFGDYMFGGGNIPWLAVGMSLIDAMWRLSIHARNTANAYARDMRLLMHSGGGPQAVVVVGLVFIPRHRESGISSAYGLLERRFSRPVRLLA